MELRIVPLKHQVQSTLAVKRQLLVEKNRFINFFTTFALLIFAYYTKFDDGQTATVYNSI
jgi:hypothetical protein